MFIMSNTTVNGTQDTDSGTDLSSVLPSPLENYIWITGIILSSLCLVLQIVLFVIRPRIRKMDQKVLTQLTVARLMNTILEFLVGNYLFNIYTLDVIFALYMQTDVVLICWMFVYTKNLYEKVVLVFVLQKWNFILLSVLIWTVVSIPLGVLCPVFLSCFPDHFTTFYAVYTWLKFIVLSLNILFFCRIFYVIVNKSKNSNRNFTEIIRTCVISFILVCITSLQVFVNDIFSYIDAVKTNAFCLINSYQAIAVTIIFLILARNNAN